MLVVREGSSDNAIVARYRYLNILFGRPARFQSYQLAWRQQTMLRNDAKASIGMRTDMCNKNNIFSIL